MRRRQHDAAKNQKQDGLSKQQKQAHRRSVSSHSSEEEVLLVWCMNFITWTVNMETMFELCTFYRVKGQWWPDLPLQQKCCLVHKLRRHSWSWVKTQRVTEMPRQETPVMPCQVHENNPYNLLPSSCIDVVSHPSFFSFSCRCFLRGFKYLQFLGRESGRWSVPGGPQQQHGLPTAP